MKFYYNDKNHRVKKESYGVLDYPIESTYYVRNVAGQVMAIYNEPTSGTALATEYPVYGSGRVGIYKPGSRPRTMYELTDHLGNVRTVFSVDDIDNDLDNEGYSDYYPFGMKMPGRDMVGNYRYAFQGQEKDSETGKEAFELRLWDSRIGRWLTTDPAGQYNSPYLGMGNNPMNRIDPDGGFDTWLGAAAYWLSHGFKGEIFENDNGDFGISNASYDDSGNLVGDLNITYGWNWEENNKNRIAVGGELGINAAYSAILLGNGWEGSISHVSFLNDPYKTSFYANSDITASLSTDVSATVGLSSYGFVAFYTGDVSQATPESFGGNFQSIRLTGEVNLIGGSIGASVTVSYSPNEAEIEHGWYVLAIGIHGNVGPDVSVAAQPVFGATFDATMPGVGYSNYLGTINNPINPAALIDKILY